MEVLVIHAEDQPDGEVVRKTASLPGERERLLREAEVLKAASERGVPGLAALVAAPSSEAAEPCMVTSAVAGPSLAVAAPLPVLEVAGVAAEVARLLACLHEAGLVHGAVEPSHVVLDGAGGAILVGFGDGGAAGAPSPDPAAGPLDPAGDVAGWGLLVSHLLDWSATSEEEPLEALRGALATRRIRRAGRRQIRGRPGGDERRVLAALADQAQDADPARRPAARSLAAAVNHRIPEARVPGAVAMAVAAPRSTSRMLDRLSAHVAPAPPAPIADVTTTPPPNGRSDTTGAGPSTPSAGRRRPPGGRKARRATGGLAVAAIPAGEAERRPQGVENGDGTGTVAIAASTPRHEGHTPEFHRPRPIFRRRWAVMAAAGALAVVGASIAAAQLRRTDRTGAELVSPPPNVACAPVSPPAADIDDDGCDEPVRWADGVLEAGTARFALGGPGDAWAVGDWDCDGRRTPALLHLGTLAVFDSWPGPGGELQGRPVAAAAGVTGLAAVTGPDGCDRPSLSRPGSADLLVDARRSP